MRLLLLVLVMSLGIGASYAAYRLLDDASYDHWRNTAKQDAQRLTAILVGWMEESFAPISALTALAENSSSVSETEFLNAFEGLESRASAFFLESAALLVRREADDDWRIRYSTDVDGPLTGQTERVSGAQLGRLIRITTDRYGETLIGAPLESRFADTLIPVGLTSLDAPEEVTIVGMINLSALMDGLFQLHASDGAHVEIRARFADPDALHEESVMFASQEHRMGAALEEEIRTVSGGAALTLIWHFAPDYRGGPSHLGSEVALGGGIALTLLVTVFLGVLMQRNREITRRVQEATEDLKRSQRGASLLKEAIDSFSDMVILYDNEERVVFTNDSYHAIYPHAPPKEDIQGYTMEALLRRSLEQGVIADPIAKSDPEHWLAETLARRRATTVSMGETTHTNGNTYLFRQTRTSDGGLIIVQMDITEQKAQERNLAEAKAEAEAAARAKSDFLATMSHEIRTPINGVMTMAKLLDETRLTADQHEMTKTIRQSSEALLTVINDILDFSKIEAGKLAIEAVSFDLLDQIESVADLLAPRAESGDLSFIVEVIEPVPARLSGDPSRLRQILLNLGSNAVKFTEMGRVVIRVLDAGGPADRYRARIEVEDSGIGMTEAQIEKLFSAFVQAESSTARRFGGTGLGLAISKRLIELMDGEIGVTSEPGKGSLFWIEIPFPIVDPTPIRPTVDLSRAAVLLPGHQPAEAESLAAALRLGGVGTVDVAARFEDVARGARRYDLVIANGRPGLPTLRQWNERLVETTAPDRPNLVVAAPHLAISALKIDQSVVAGSRFLGTIKMPTHLRRLWDLVAVALGALSIEDIQKASEAEQVYTAPDPETARNNGAMVLVAEDNPTNQVVISRVLDRMGIAHEMAADGKIALDMLGERHFDLLLSDFHMPVMDGFELTRRIRDREGETGDDHLPIVALTADVLPETARRCEEVGMDGYLRKPIEIDRLESVLRTHLPAAFELRTIRLPEPEQPIAAEPDSSAPLRHLVSGVDPDIFDPDALVDAFGDFDRDAADFVLRFADSLRTEIDRLNAAFAAEDYDTARHVAHAMKGAALSTGALRTGRLMKDIQDALDDGDSDTADIYRDGLDETLSELLDALTPLRASPRTERSGATA